MVPISGSRWCFRVWTVLGEKPYLTEHAAVTICYESSPLPCCSGKPKECLGFQGSLIWASSLAREMGRMSPSTVTTAVKWLEHTLAMVGLRPGPRPAVTAQGDGAHFISAAGSLPLRPLAHSRRLIFLVLSSLFQRSNSPVPRQWDGEMNRTCSSLQRVMA